MGLPLPLVVLLSIGGRINLGKVHAGWRDLDRQAPDIPFHGVHHTHMRERAVNFGAAGWADRLLGTFVDPQTVFPESWALSAAPSADVAPVTTPQGSDSAGNHRTRGRSPAPAGARATDSKVD
jgi:hypothetical protein